MQKKIQKSAIFEDFYVALILYFLQNYVASR